MELGRMRVSENLLGQLRDNPRVETCGPSRPIKFDSQGQVVEAMAVGSAA